MRQQEFPSLVAFLSQERTSDKQTHVIFESRNGEKARRDGWLDYCREEPGFAGQAAHDWAKAQCAQLAKRIGCETRYRIEVW